MSVAKRRRAVYTALSKFLSGDELLEVLVYWDERFADKPSFALNSFISSFVDKCDPSISRSILLRELAYQLMQPENQLLADPGVVSFGDVEKGDNKSFSTPLSMRPAVHYRVFMCLVQSMLLRLNPDVRRELSNNLIVKLPLLNIDQPSFDALKNWFSCETGLYLETVEVSSLKELLNFFYIEMCELIGPVEADQILASQARQVHETEDGNIFTPYHFL